MSDSPPTDAEILARLREAWDQALQGGENVSIRIALLTPDGQPGQPLAYDIVERTADSLATYTLVERPDEASAWLGLAAVGADEAREALRGLASSARDDAPEGVAETVVGAFRPSERLGVTWGVHRLTDGGALLFPTDYRHWFASERLLHAQGESTGEPWARVRLTLLADGGMTLDFG